MSSPRAGPPKGTFCCWNVRHGIDAGGAPEQVGPWGSPWEAPTLDAAERA
jgi:hypothetical protein